MVDDLNMVAERCAIDEVGDVWLTEQQQRRVIRKMWRDYKALNTARSDLRVYLRDILLRLEEDPS